MGPNLNVVLILVVVGEKGVRYSLIKGNLGLAGNVS